MLVKHISTKYAQSVIKQLGGGTYLSINEEAICLISMLLEKYIDLACDYLFQHGLSRHQLRKAAVTIFNKDLAKRMLKFINSNGTANHVFTSTNVLVEEPHLNSLDRKQQLKAVQSNTSLSSLVDDTKSTSNLVSPSSSISEIGVQFDSLEELKFNLVNKVINYGNLGAKVINKDKKLFGFNNCKSEFKLRGGRLQQSLDGLVGDMNGMLMFLAHKLLRESAMLAMKFCNEKSGIGVTLDHILKLNLVEKEFQPLYTGLDVQKYLQLLPDECNSDITLLNRLLAPKNSSEAINSLGMVEGSCQSEPNLDLLMLPRGRDRDHRRSHQFLGTHANFTGTEVSDQFDTNMFTVEVVENLDAAPFDPNLKFSSLSLTQSPEINPLPYDQQNNSSTSLHSNFSSQTKVSSLAKSIKKIFGKTSPPSSQSTPSSTPNLVAVTVPNIPTNSNETSPSPPPTSDLDLNSDLDTSIEITLSDDKFDSQSILTNSTNQSSQWPQFEKLLTSNCTLKLTLQSTSIHRDPILRRKV